MCTENAMLPAGGSVSTDCVCNAGYSRYDVSACVACAAGKYKNTTGNMECTLCSSAKFSTSVGALNETTCKACQEHANSSAGSSAKFDCKCNPGYSGSSTVCKKCPIGRYKDFPGNLQCTACAEGKYSEALGAVTADVCRDCPEHSTSHVRSDTVYDCICKAGATGEAGGPCVLCEVGKYKSVSGRIECTSCPASSTSAAGSTLESDCVVPCNAGYTGALCTACVAGTFKNTTGSAECTQCPAGTFSTTVGAWNETLCVSCQENANSAAGAKVQQDCVCKPGYYGSSSPPICVQCQRGSYKDYSGNNPCTNCVEGTYSTQDAADTIEACLPCQEHSSSQERSQQPTHCVCNAGATGANGGSCVLCQKGQYKTATGHLPCSTCPVNTSSHVGSTLESNCLAPCSPGYTGLPCTACVANKYKSTTGDAACESCPAGSSSPEASVSPTACVCDAGYSGNNGGPCVACPEGTYKATTGTAVCASCPVHSEPNNITGAAGCHCLPGYVGVDECRMCAAGTYKDKTGSADNLCISCPIYSMSAAGSTSITACACNAGYWGVGVCTACNIGTYSETQGATQASMCITCPINTTSEAGSAAVTACVCRAGYWGVGGTKHCTACAIGTYSVVQGAAQSDTCIQCHGNMTSRAGSAAATACVCNAGFWRVESCSGCAAGTYSFAIGATENSTCIPCPGNATSNAASPSIAFCRCDAPFGGSVNNGCKLTDLSSYESIQAKLTAIDVKRELSVKFPGVFDDVSDAGLHTTDDKKLVYSISVFSPLIQKDMVDKLTLWMAGIVDDANIKVAVVVKVISSRRRLLSEAHVWQSVTFEFTPVTHDRIEDLYEKYKTNNIALACALFLPILACVFSAACFCTYTRSENEHEYDEQNHYHEIHAQHMHKVPHP